MCLATSNNLLLVLQDAPKRFFSTNSRSSGQPKNAPKTLFFHPPSPFPGIFLRLQLFLAFVLLRNSRFNYQRYTQREATPSQKSARKCAATSRDFLRERLQSAFTLANQLRCIAQQRSRSARKKRIALYSCPCEALRARLEMRPSTSVDIKNKKK